MAGLGQGIGFDLWQLQHQVQLRLEARTAELGLTLPQVATLNRLDAEPGIRSVDLAAQLLLTPQAVSLTIVKLAAAGYIDRSAPGTGRSRPLTITPAGRAVLARAEAVVADVHDELFGTLGDDRDRLEALLHRALTVVRDLPPGPPSSGGPAAG